MASGASGASGAAPALLVVKVQKSKGRPQAVYNDAWGILFKRPRWNSSMLVCCRSQNFPSCFKKYFVSIYLSLRCV